MPALKNHRLFISHSWTYEDAYKKLAGFFDKHPNFKWADYSVPKDNPIHEADNEDDLFIAIQRQIASVNCVVILAGVYSSYSRWITKEIEISKQIYDKPIVAVEPWGAERTSQVVKSNADAVVSWRSDSIVSAIRTHSI